MLLAAIDIGTNAVRLYFSNVYSYKEQLIVEKASLVRIPIRLGEDVFTSQRISEEKLRRLIKTMQAFKLLIEVYEPVAWKALATSAMREASNQEEVITRVAKETGINIVVIDGLEEANLVGAFNEMHVPYKKKQMMYIDVGGGSTEISLFKDGKLVTSNSFKIGTVRLLKGKVEQQEWKDLRNWLKLLKQYKDNLLLVGSGGNINKINKLYGKIPENILSFSRLEFALRDLAAYSLDQRIEQLGMRPDRADVIIPAGEIFRFIMRQVNAELIYVPKIGLSDGMVTHLFREQMAQRVI